MMVSGGMLQFTRLVWNILLSGGMYWFVRRRQRRIQAQMVLFKRSGLWARTGETRALLAEEAEEGEEEEEEAGKDGGVVAEVPEQTEDVL